MTFPHTATIERLSIVGSKQVYGSNGTTECFLQPIDAESVQLYKMVFTKGSNCYLPLGADVKEGDYLTIDGTRYGVRGIRTHNYGSLKHKVAVLEQK